MSDLQEDALDALLLEQFEGPVPADGFCDRVMRYVPARRGRRAWPFAAGLLAGIAGCWFALLSAPLPRVGWRDWLRGEPSAPAMMVLLSIMGISLLALLWIAAEEGDRTSEARW